MSEERYAGAPGSAVPTCYRHPGRETYIRCTRCERPICPDCMTSAAVGFQCPECVAEGRRTQRSASTVFGAELANQSDLVTKILVVVNVAVYALQILVPSLTARGEILPVAVADGEWWRLITAGFMHYSVVHILFNMVALWTIGRVLEPQLGRSRFITLYFVSLLAGSTASYVFGVPIGASAGASGAIFGLFGALFVVAARMRWDLRPFIGLLLINGLLVLLDHNIDWHAHVGGAIAGSLLAAAFAYSPPAWRTQLGIATAVALVVVCVALISYRTAELKSSPIYGPLIGTGQDFITGNDVRPFP